MKYLPAIVTRSYAEYLSEMDRLKKEGWQPAGYCCNSARFVNGNCSVIVCQFD